MKKISIKKILWATDFSRESLSALDYALFFREKFNAKLMAIHVIPTLPSLIYDDAFIDSNEMELNFLRITKAATKKIKAIEKRKNIKFDKIIVNDGAAYEKIIESVKENNIDMIFLGKKSHPLWEKLLIGSTANRLIHHCNIPMFLSSKKKRNMEFSDILVPVDLEPIMERELRWAEHLARKFDSVIDVIHVMELYEYEFPFEVLEKLVQKLSKRLDNSLKDVKATAKHTIIKAINAADAIVEYAKKKKSDLIITATHSRSGLSKFFMGSVSEKIVSRSQSPVLLLPNRED